MSDSLDASEEISLVELPDVDKVELGVQHATRREQKGGEGPGPTLWSGTTSRFQSASQHISPLRITDCRAMKRRVLEIQVETPSPACV